MNKNYLPVSRTVGGLIEDLFQNGIRWSGAFSMEDTMNVPVNIRETEKAYELNVVAPGIKKEAFRLNVEKNVLTISYEHKEEHREQSGKVHRMEYRMRSFKRSFTLNDKVDASSISARYNDGILHVVLPKKETAGQEATEIVVA